MLRGSLKYLVAGSLAALAAGQAGAADILCKRAVNEHMTVSDSFVGTCLDAGMGNINGSNNDGFLDSPASAGYTFIGSSDGANPFDISFTSVNNPGGLGSTGTFAFDPSVWDLYTGLAIGFKFGTGNQADEWFVYALLEDVSSGTWRFIENSRAGGSGLSHVNLYGIASSGPGELPEPAGLALLGIGALGLAVFRRKDRPRH